MLLQKLLAHHIMAKLFRGLRHYNVPGPFLYGQTNRMFFDKFIGPGSG
jgi:hypothetical protein